MDLVFDKNASREKRLKIFQKMQLNIVSSLTVATHENK